MTKIDSKYMESILVNDTGKTFVYQIVSKTGWVCSEYVLGHIKWYGAWRQYCFMPSPGMVFNESCLQDIRVFINKLMDERKS